MAKCILCKSSKKDAIQYGEFLENENFGVHTFCLYLSSNLSQNGEDDTHFFGFLESDIRKETKRISSLRCYYCRQKYANIGCCAKKCRRSFHLICGIENDAENRFCMDFRSYCSTHARGVKERPSHNETCLICFESLFNRSKKFNKMSMILTPCCRNGWCHKLCLQKFAMTAGYFFKCPLCNDTKVFREKLPERGIFIPNQDAAWELEPNAFAELLERPNECAAEQCGNRAGRKAFSDSNPFVMCNACGSIALHTKCLPNADKLFYCADCTVAAQDGDSGRESLNSLVNHSDDEYIEVCHVSDKEDVDIVNRIIAGNMNMEENKIDSGKHNETYSSDEDMPHRARKCTRRVVLSSEDDNLTSDTESEDVIKPFACKRRKCSRLESESSELVQEIETRTRTVTESSEEIATESIARRRKKIGIIIMSDSEDDDVSAEPRHVDGNKTHISIKTDDSDEEHLETEQNDANSCKKKMSQGQNMSNERHKRRSLANLNCKNSKADNLDISCIAKRTRRRTFCSSSSSSNKKMEQNEKENPLDISCIAVRTRRKTMCAQTDFSKCKRTEMSSVYEKLCKSSETFDIVTESDDSKEFLEDTAQNNFKVTDDCAEKSNSILDVSCIANRTRRRKSFPKNYKQLARIDEISDSNSDNSNSLDFLNNSSTSRGMNRFVRSDSCKKLEAKPYTLSNAEMNYKNIENKKAGSTFFLEKFPHQNFPVLKPLNNTKSSNSNNIYNYRPSNSYCPHSIKRSRL